MPDPRFLDATAKANWRATGVPSDNTSLRALSRRRVDPAANSCRSGTVTGRRYAGSAACGNSQAQRVARPAERSLTPFVDAAVHYSPGRPIRSNSGFASRSGRSSLTATIPLSDTSMARHTSPIPPVAIGAVSRHRLSSTSPAHNTSKLSPSVPDPRGHPHPVPAASSSLGSGESSVSERGVEQTYAPWRSYRVRVARPAAAGAGAAGHLVERGEAVPQELAAHRLVAADPVSDW